jgi:hypothetical protein
MKAYSPARLFGQIMKKAGKHKLSGLVDQTIRLI